MFIQQQLELNDQCQVSWASHGPVLVVRLRLFMDACRSVTAARASLCRLLELWMELGNSFPLGENSKNYCLSSHHHSQSGGPPHPSCSSLCCLHCCHCGCRFGGWGGEAVCRGCSNALLVVTCIQLYCRFSSGMPYRSLSLNWLRRVSKQSRHTATISLFSIVITPLRVLW